MVFAEEATVIARSARLLASGSNNTFLMRATPSIINYHSLFNKTRSVFASQTVRKRPSVPESAKVRMNPILV
jgi:hypothetical protein